MSMELRTVAEVKIQGTVKVRDMRKGMIVMLGAFTPFRIIDVVNTNARTRVKMAAPDGTKVFAQFDPDWEYNMIGDFGA